MLEAKYLLSETNTFFIFGVGIYKYTYVCTYNRMQNPPAPTDADTHKRQTHNVGRKNIKLGNGFCQISPFL